MEEAFWERFGRPLLLWIDSANYMWPGEESSAEDAWHVSYNGRVQQQPKSWGNPRHGYRCVKKPGIMKIGVANRC